MTTMMTTTTVTTTVIMGTNGKPPYGKAIRGSRIEKIIEDVIATSKSVFKLPPMSPSGLEQFDKAMIKRGGKKNGKKK